MRWGVSSLGILALICIVDRAQVMAPATPLTEEARGAILALARAAVEGGSGGAADALTGATEGVIITLWQHDRPPRRGAWAGDGEAAPIPAAVRHAAESLREETGGRLPPGARLQVDVAVDSRPLPAWIPGAAWWLINPGLDGLAVEGEAGIRLISPDDLFLSGLGPEAWARAAVEGTPGGGSLRRIRVVSQIEGPPDEPGPRAWIRGTTSLLGRDAARLERACRDAAGYLARAIDDEGRYCYSWDAQSADCGGGYNILRHGGSTFSLLQAYGRFGDPTWLPPARRALDYLIAQSRVEAGPPARRFVVEGRQAKLGGAGLGLLALAEYTRVTGDGRYRQEMTELGDFILSMQRPDGFLESWHAWNPEYDVPKTRSIYYPGEALLALVALYGVDPQPRWLEAARLSASFLVHKRWAWMGTEIQVPPDAWLTQALTALMAVSPDPAYETYVYRIAEVLAGWQLRSGEAPEPKELAGAPVTSPDLPSVAVAGGRNEGLTAAWRMATAQGQRARAEALADLSLGLTWFSVEHQLRAANTVGLPDPAWALGAVPEAPGSFEVRNDYVQHNLSGWLGALDILAAAEAGAGGGR